jgi:mono/diheme cytochrome c family protein
MTRWDNGKSVPPPPLWSLFMKTMRLKMMVVACVMTLDLCGESRAGQLDPEELPSRVRSIFLAKCSECHGRGLSRPRAALYLDKLGQLAANPEWVVPHEPEKSYLWALIRDDDMPAKGAKAGPLNAQEKEIIHAWIAAGAPVPPSSASLAHDSTGTVTPEPAIEPQPLTTRLFALLGRFHILVIHFPIALLMAAAFAETIAAWRGSWVPSPAVRFCVLMGATSALTAVALGWLHADVGGFGRASTSILAVHRWLGTIAGLAAAAIAVVSERDSRRGRRSTSFRIALWTGASVVAAAAHFGGLMVHGNGFFDLY